MGQKRFENIDVCKGILILMVVVNHGFSMIAVRDSVPAYWLSTVDMPAFFLVSGLLYNHAKWSRRGFISFALNRVQTLLIPYLFFELVGGALVELILGHWSGLGVVGLLSGALRLLRNALTVSCNLGPDWFLITLFAAELLLYAAMSLSARRPGLLYVCLLVALIPTILYVHSDISNWIVDGLLWRGTRVLISFVLLVLGAKYRDLFLRQPYKTVYLLAALAITCLSAVFCGRPSMYAMSFRSVILFLIAGCAGAYFVLGVSAKIHSRLLIYIGKGSLTLLGTHAVVREVIHRGSGFSWPEPASTFFLYLAVVAVSAAICIPLFPKIVPHMIGRKLIWDDRNRKES